MTLGHYLLFAAVLLTVLGIAGAQFQRGGRRYVHRFSR